MREALRLGPVVGDYAAWLLGGLAALATALFVAFSLVWRAAPSLTKKELRRLEEYRAVVKHLAAQVRRRAARGGRGGCALPSLDPMDQLGLCRWRCPPAPTLRFARAGAAPVRRVLQQHRA